MMNLGMFETDLARGVEIRKGFNGYWFVENINTGKMLYQGQCKQTATKIYEGKSFRLEAVTESGCQIVLCDIKRFKPNDPKYGISFASTDVLSGNNFEKIKKAFNALTRSRASTIVEMRKIALEVIS